MAVLTSKHNPVIFIKENDADKLFRTRTKPEIISRILRESAEFQQLIVADETGKKEK